MTIEQDEYVVSCAVAVMRRWRSLRIGLGLRPLRNIWDVEQNDDVYVFTEQKRAKMVDVYDVYGVPNDHSTTL